jgi:2-methylisocitrate lyase-like PEP mutase family enzyme
MTVSGAADLGVRRISVGGTLARTAWGTFLAAAQEIAEQGTFSHFADLPNVDSLLDG